MPSLPPVTGRQAVRAFQKVGFQVIRVSGSHHVMKREGHPYALSIPVHGNKALGTGLLSSLIAAAGLTVEQFIALL